MYVRVAGPEEEEKDKREERTISVPDNSKVIRGPGGAGNAQEGQSQDEARKITRVGERGSGELKGRGRGHRDRRLDERLVRWKRVASALNVRRSGVGYGSLAGRGQDHRSVNGRGRFGRSHDTQ